MIELREEIRDDGLRHYWMHRITVDDIYGSNNKDYGFQFYTVKTDRYDWEGAENEEGYVDDSEGSEAGVYWDSPYSPLPYSLGPIDEKRWIEDNVIVPEGYYA